VTESCDVTRQQRSSECAVSDLDRPAQRANSSSVMEGSTPLSTEPLTASAGCGALGAGKTCAARLPCSIRAKPARFHLQGAAASWGLPRAARGAYLTQRPSPMGERWTRT